MKKILLFLAVFILAVPLFSSVTFSGDVDENVRERFTGAVEKAIGERKERAVTVSDYREEDGVIYCTLSFSGKSIDFVSPEEYFESNIDSVFYYEESLYEDGEILDYIYKGTFSSISLLQPKRGENYVVRTASGKAGALLLVESVYDNGVMLSPLYLSTVLPGMKMERVNDFSLSFNGFTDKTLRSYGASISLSYSSLCYPLEPFFEVAWIGGKNSAYYALLGFSSTFSLGSVWPGIPVIRNIRVTGDAAVGAAYSSSLKLSGKYGISLSYAFTRYFSLAVSLLNYGGNFYYSLGAFVKL